MNLNSDKKPVTRYRNVEAHADPIYCQSNEILKNPKPSLPSEPPKKFVNISTTFFEACCDAKQKTLNPFKSGKIYDGKTS